MAHMTEVIRVLLQLITVNNMAIQIYRLPPGTTEALIVDDSLVLMSLIDQSQNLTIVADLEKVIQEIFLYLHIQGRLPIGVTVAPPVDTPPIQCLHVEQPFAREINDGRSNDYLFPFHFFPLFKSFKTKKFTLRQQNVFLSCVLVSVSKVWWDRELT